jgi:molecular chaperone GrpE (heat shock protein)
MGQPPYGDPRGGGPGERGPYGPGDAPPPRWPHGDARSMEANDPEMFKVLKEDMDLDRKSRELAVQYRQAPSAQRDAIKKLLEQVVDQHFEVRQQRHALELKRLEQEIKNLHERMDRRVKARKEIVAKRVSELLGVEDDLHF